MSESSDIREYPQSHYDIKRLELELTRFIRSRFEAIDKAVDSLSEEEIIELTNYITYFYRNHDKELLSPDVNLDKIKTFILLYSKLSDNDDTYNVLSYFESVEFGWHGDSYYLNNNCLRRHLYRPKEHCKMAEKISYSDSVIPFLGDMYDIFFSNDFSRITLLVFCYCLASVYSSMLNAGGVYAPMFLQIAVDKGSVAYQVLKEIVEICDVNFGILEKCKHSDSSYIHCNCASQIYFPTQFVRNDIDNLIRDSKDRPVLIVGHENEHGYTALLREIANIPTKKKALDLKIRFNLLPLFICPEIKSSFDNVFSIDLTDVEVSSDYLMLVKNRKNILASWALELITGANTYPQEKESIDMRRIATNRSVISRRIRPYINQICQNHAELMTNGARNVGFLNFFSKDT